MSKETTKHVMIYKFYILLGIWGLFIYGLGMMHEIRYETIWWIYAVLTSIFGTYLSIFVDDHFKE